MSVFTDLLGIDVPLVLGPFGGLSSVALTAAVSEEGGFGSHGLYGYDSQRIRRVGEELRSATGRPFALNLWLPTGGEVEPGPEHDRYAQALASLFAEVGAAAAGTLRVAAGETARRRVGRGAPDVLTIGASASWGPRRPWPRPPGTGSRS